MYLLGFGNIRVNVKIDPIVIEMCVFFPDLRLLVPVARADEYLIGIGSFQPFPRTKWVNHCACYQVVFTGLPFPVIHS